MITPKTQGPRELYERFGNENLLPSRVFLERSLVLAVIDTEAL